MPDTITHKGRLDKIKYRILDISYREAILNEVFLINKTGHMAFLGPSSSEYFLESRFRDEI